ncbi:MAG: hypothetical protein KHX55_05610 [Proteobacteria bacterium]|nr:hypothetical protein [Pseudomonadota bacterium]
MNKICLIVLMLLFRSWPAQAQSVNPLSFEVLSEEWKTAENTPLYVSFENPERLLRLYIYTDPLVFNSGCKRNTSRKDVKFDVVVYRGGDDGRPHLNKALNMLKLKIRKDKRMTNVKPNIIDRYDRKSMFAEEEILRLGKAQFVSPYSCGELDDSEFEFSGMRVDSKTVPPLKLRLRIGWQ